jgi:hypothetical protein
LAESSNGILQSKKPTRVIIQKLQGIKGRASHYLSRIDKVNVLETTSTMASQILEGSDEDFLQCIANGQNEATNDQNKPAKLSRQTSFIDRAPPKPTHLDGLPATPKTFSYFRQISPIKYIVAFQGKVGVGVALDGRFVFKKNWMFDIETAQVILQAAGPTSSVIEKLGTYETLIKRIIVDSGEFTGYFLTTDWHEKFGYTVHLRWHLKKNSASQSQTPGQQATNGEGAGGVLTNGQEKKDDKEYGRGVAFSIEEFKTFLHYLPHAAVWAKSCMMSQQDLMRNVVNGVGRNVVANVKKDKFAMAAAVAEPYPVAFSQTKKWFTAMDDGKLDAKLKESVRQIMPEDVDTLWIPILSLFVMGQLVISDTFPKLAKGIRTEATLRCLGLYNQKGADEFRMKYSNETCQNAQAQQLPLPPNATTSEQTQPPAAEFAQHAQVAPGVQHAA